VVESLLKADHPSDWHNRLLAAVNGNLEHDSEFWKTLSPESVDLGFDSRCRFLIIPVTIENFRPIATNIYPRIMGKMPLKVHFNNYFL
jgi:hypothetical protein